MLSSGSTALSWPRSERHGAEACPIESKLVPQQRHDNYGDYLLPMRGGMDFLYWYHIGTITEMDGVATPSSLSLGMESFWLAVLPHPITYFFF